MKIETDKVKKHLDEIKYQLSGMEESIRSWDDGLLESLKSQIADAKKEINKFITLELTEKVVDPLDFAGRSYLVNAKAVIERIETGKGLGSSDNILYYKHKLYNWLKREYKKKIDGGFTHTDEQTIHVITLLATEDAHWGKLEQQMMYAFMAVYDDLSQDLNKIRQEQRKNSEQQKLFE